MKYSRLVGAFFFFPLILILADYGINVRGYGESVFSHPGDGVLFVHIAVFVLYLVLIYQNMKSREIRDVRDSRSNDEISSLRKQLAIKEEMIAKLQRPQYECECELTRSDRELLDSIRILKTINTKELAVFMERAELTMQHNINRVIKKLGLPGRVELFAYVMLSIPDITE